MSTGKVIVIVGIWASIAAVAVFGGQTVVSILAISGGTLATMVIMATR